MSYNADVQIRRGTLPAAREIKASSHYTYMQTGGTLKGAAFAVAELVQEGQCLVREKSTKKYVKYDAALETTPGTFPSTLYDNPIVLDESVRFNPKDDGTNPDTLFGQAIVHGSVYAGMCIGLTDAFKQELAGAVRFISA